MDLIKFPAKKKWAGLLKRPASDSVSMEKKVSKIIAAVKKDGDKAVKKYAKRFDGIKSGNLLVTPEEIAAASAAVSPELKTAIVLAKNNIEKFHIAQVQPVQKMDTMPGVTCWRKNVAIEKIGLYIPGGTAPLFSTILMLGIPAMLAGCKEIILCSPPSPGNSKNPGLNPVILYTASLVGVTRIFKAGGAQAIAAMAFGTQTIPQVYKIFGPGNQFVTCAKQLVIRTGVAIDMPAGPSEVAIFADGTANPGYIAADLLSQAEHGTDSQVLLVTSDRSIADRVRTALKTQLNGLSRKAIAEKALSNSKIILMKNETDAMDLLNAYAPEHLILSCANAQTLAEAVVNAGSVFIGHYSPESAGDYASGTNHTLPTNGYAKTYSGVSVDSFVKKITYQQLTKEGLQSIGPAVIAMAEAEGLTAHAAAVSIRVKNK